MSACASITVNRALLNVMGVYLFQNSSILKYRVSRKIDGKDVQLYYDRTPTGRKDAYAKDAELKARQDKGRQIGSGSKAFREMDNKAFPTGVVNVTLTIDRTGTPAFRLMLMLDHTEPPITRQRSIIKHGWEKSWKEICKALYKAKGLRGRHPPVPCIRKGKRYLRSVGVERRFLKFS
ncbi:MAG: hypothetical protein V3U84_02135 [Thiotrichaceae bacterium]